MRKIHEESAEQTTKSIKDLEKMGAGWAKESLKESAEYSIAEINYYEQVFQFVGNMKYKIDEITDKIKTYDRYSYKGGWVTSISLLIMVVTGLLVPFVALFANVYWLPLEVVEILVGVGFALSTIAAVLLLYRGISTEQVSRP